MGVCLTSNYKGALSLYAGYGSFMILRRTAAKVVLGKDYWKYESWLKTDDRTPQEELHEKCKAIYSKCDALWNFVSQSDCEGKLSYKDCGTLYNLLKDSKEDFSFCYGAYYTEDKRQDFINLLKGCYSHRAFLRWN